MRVARSSTESHFGHFSRQIMARGFIVLAPLTLLFWAIRPAWAQKFRIPQPRNANTRMRKEIVHTIISLSVYLIPTVIVAIAYLWKFHELHHRSYNVTPVSSYSFHIVEAVLIMLSYLLITLVVPWHPLALTLFGLFGILQNGYLHLGHDFAVEWRERNRIFRWLYSSTIDSA